MDIEEVFKGVGSAEKSFKSCSGIHVKCVGCVSILTGAHVGVVIIATHAACKMNREISFSLEEKKNDRHLSWFGLLLLCYYAIQSLSRDIASIVKTKGKF